MGVVVEGGCRGLPAEPGGFWLAEGCCLFVGGGADFVAEQDVEGFGELAGDGGVGFDVDIEAERERIARKAKPAFTSPIKRFGCGSSGGTSAWPDLRVNGDGVRRLCAFSAA